MIRLQQGLAAKKRAEEEADAIKKAGATAFADAVAYALGAGMKPQAVAKETGVHYETIRRIARERNVERLREPTVTSRTKQQPGPAPS